MRPEIIQVISIGICILGILLWIVLAAQMPQYAGWFVLPISIYVVNAIFYSYALLVDLQRTNIDQFLFLAAVRTLYTLLILTASSGAMLRVIWKRQQS